MSRPFIRRIGKRLTQDLRWVSLSSCLVLTLGLISCNTAAPPEPDSGTAPVTVPETAPTTVPETAPATNSAQSTSSQTSAQTVPQTTREKVKFKQGDTELFSIKYKDDGAKLEDASGAELARFTLDESGKVKIKDAADVVLGYIVSRPGVWKVENADQTQELYIFRRQDDGDYKLEDGSDTQIYRVKMRDYGYEIETPDKQSLYKVKQKENKISLRDASEETVLSTKDSVVPVAIAPFGFDVLTREQQAALSFAVNATGGN